MSLTGNLNMRNPAVKRIMREFQQFQNDPSADFVAAPLEDNVFEWHFTIKGPPGTPFEEGKYHGRIMLPPDYPFKPPDIILMTPNGRFQLSTKICLSITGYHPRNWQPSWGIRTVLIALTAFFPTDPRGAIGSLEFPDDEKRRLAIKSGQWKCERCGKTNDELLAAVAAAGNKASEERKQQQQSDQSESNAEKTDAEVQQPHSGAAMGESGAPAAELAVPQREPVVPNTAAVAATAAAVRQRARVGRARAAVPATEARTGRRRQHDDDILSKLTLGISLLIFLLLFRKVVIWVQSDPLAPFS